MKCKFGIVSIMLAGLALTATAQTKEKYYSEKFKDNIFISAGVGAQACVNPDNFDYGFGHAITPLIHVSVGKLVQSYLGSSRTSCRIMVDTVYRARTNKRRLCRG